MATRKPTPPPADESSVFSKPTPSTGYEGVRGAAVVPDDGRAGRLAELPPTMPSTPAFQLMYDPKRLTVIDGHVVPLFKRLKFMPGVGGVDQRTGRNGVTHPIVGSARGAREDKGEIAIPFDRIPRAHLGRADLHQTPGGQPSYLYSPKGRPDVVLTIYDRCYAGTDRIELRRKEWVEFCIALRDEHGVIPPYQGWVLRNLLERYEGMADKATEAAAQFPHRRRHAAAMQAVVEALRAELAKLSETPAPIASGDAVHLEA